MKNIKIKGIKKPLVSGIILHLKVIDTFISTTLKRGILCSYFWFTYRLWFWFKL